VFPESILLDNVIFSGDNPVKIEGESVVGMQTTEETKDVCGAIVFWQVSEKHGGRRIQEKTQSSVSATYSFETSEKLPLYEFKNLLVQCWIYVLYYWYCSEVILSQRVLQCLAGFAGQWPGSYNVWPGSLARRE
jgi:hypothetical protein